MVIIVTFNVFTKHIRRLLWHGFVKDVVEQTVQMRIGVVNVEETNETNKGGFKMKPMNFDTQETMKQREARERSEAYSKITPNQQLQRLDNILGKDIGAVKERAKLKQLIDEGYGNQTFEFIREVKSNAKKSVKK